MTGIQYDAVPMVRPSGPNTVSALMRGSAARLSGVEVLEKLLARDRARRRRRHRVQPEQSVQPIGGDLLARDALHVGLHRLPGRARAVRELGAERQRRAAVIQLEAHDRRVRMRSSSSSSDIPRKRPGRLEARRADRAGWRARGACPSVRRAGRRDRVGRRRGRAQVRTARTRRSWPRSAARRQAELGQDVSLQAQRRQIYLIGGAASCYVDRRCRRARLCLLHVPQADCGRRRG